MKSPVWYKNDKTTTENFKIVNFISQYGLKQIINKATDILTTRLLVLICFSHRNLI